MQVQPVTLILAWSILRKGRCEIPSDTAAEKCQRPLRDPLHGYRDPPSTGYMAAACHLPLATEVVALVALPRGMAIYGYAFKYRSEANRGPLFHHHHHHQHHPTPSHPHLHPYHHYPLAIADLQHAPCSGSTRSVIPLHGIAA